MMPQADCISVLSDASAVRHLLNAKETRIRNYMWHIAASQVRAVAHNLACVRVGDASGQSLDYAFLTASSS
eukprot:6198186-Pleurochrysis_carterae.AAC.4